MQSPNIPSKDPTSAPDRKRLRLQVSIETSADGKNHVQQVFSDGSYVPATDTHFERTSAIATAFVTRALAAPTGTASIETNAAESRLPSARWAAKAVTGIEGTLYELGRALAVIEALRSQQPLLQLKRTAGRTVRQGDGAPSEVVEKEGEGMMQMKKRLVARSAEFLDDKVKAARKWVQADNAFCDAMLIVRKRCNGVRRSPDGVPLIDVGDADFVPVSRAQEINAGEETIEISTGEESQGSKRLVHVQFPPQTYLKFGLNSVESESTTATAPVVMESERQAEEKSLIAFIRRVRLARVSAFRLKTFDQIHNEADSLPLLTELTTNSLGVESGPVDILRLEKTKQSESAKSLDVGTEGGADDVVASQTASLLQILAMHACLTQVVNTGSQSPTIMDRVLAVTSAMSVLQRTEEVLDKAVEVLPVRLEWTRGSSRLEEARIKVFSITTDGDGPERALATIEPISGVNNGGKESNNGHVRITPAFGVIIAAPDDPSARGRAVAPHPSSSGGGSSALGLDDVPRSYVCPVGGEVLSVLTLLLCIRLLDALEAEARAGVEEMLDVDRQCFTVIVCAPRNGHTLKAKVWPKGSGVGAEVPGSTAWFNGQKIHSFPAVGPGRVAAWRDLLKKLVDGNVDTGNDPTEVKEEEGVDAGQNGAAKNTERNEEGLDVAVGNTGLPNTASQRQSRDVTAARAAAAASAAAQAAAQAAARFGFGQSATDSGQFQFEL
eukprot:GFKZ01015558.1.p1 GENE.GFKZ01015558.1~~GFKZ01015558.1.p1  ORF type:complete len:749 (+),score=137.43 GFKZ01015558.1:73-2247(+)